MDSVDVRDVIGIIGGTGPLGRGLAARWSVAGHEVQIGSRTVDKAQRAVEDVVGRTAGGVNVTPGTNADVGDAAEVVVIAVPYAAQVAALPALADACAGKVVCSVVNPMTFDDRGPRAVRVHAGSAAEECQQLLPEARVVSAFHDVSSRRLLDVDERIETHVLVCSDDRAAARRVLGLASLIDGMAGVYCGPLNLSEYIENITPVILSINRLHGIEAGLIIDGVDIDAPSGEAIPRIPSGLIRDGEDSFG